MDQRASPRIVTYGCVALVSMILSWTSWSMAGTLDVESHWLPWLTRLSRFGLIDGYAAIVDDYPPGTATLLFLASRVLPAAGEMAVFKSLVACAQLGSTLLFVMHTGRAGISLFYLLAVALSASFLGYLDILFAIPLIVSLFAALENRPIVSAAMFGIACFIKWQPLIVLPFMAVIWCGQAKALRRGPLIAAASLLTTGAFGIAYLFWPQIWNAFYSAFHQIQWSAEALNFPWLVQILLGYGVQNINAPAYALTALRILFYAIYLLIFTVGALRCRGNPEQMMTFALVGYVAYFMFAPSVHENHLFLAMLLAIVLWSRSQHMRTVAIFLAVYTNLNLACFYGVTGEQPFSTGPKFALLTGAIAATGVLSFVYLLRLLFMLPAEPLGRPLVDASDVLPGNVHV